MSGICNLYLCIIGELHAGEVRIKGKIEAKIYGALNINQQETIQSREEAACGRGGGSGKVAEIIE